MKQLALAVPAAVLALACGGKGSSPKHPALAMDPCMLGIHASGVSAKAATWDAVAAFASTTADAVCQSSPCSPDEAVSFVGAAPDDAVAIKVDGGWTVIGDVWDSDEEGMPAAKVTKLGDLLWLQLDTEQLGHEPVTLDDGEETTATVVVGRTLQDFVIEPASGRVLWRAVCGGEGDAWRPTVVTRDGATFGYVRCEGDETPVQFTAEQGAACPSYHEGAQ